MKPIFKRKIDAMPDSTKQAIKLLWQPAVLALSVLVVLVASSTAWFASNRTLDAAGMSAQIEVSRNLIIKKQAAEIAGADISSEAFRVDFPDATAFLKPATHNNDSPTKLIYNSLSAEVSPDTGLGATTFANVTSTEYYHDYTVYIAATGAAMDISALNATMMLIDPVTAAAATGYPDYWNAASIDFYVGGTYAGTRNIAAKTGNAPTPLDLTGETTIPQNTAGYLTVLMRFYFDGALTPADNSSMAYVRTSGLQLGDYDLKVNFTAAE